MSSDSALQAFHPMPEESKKFKYRCSYTDNRGNQKEIQSNNLRKLKEEMKDIGLQYGTIWHSGIGFLLTSRVNQTYANYIIYRPRF